MWPLRAPAFLPRSGSTRREFQDEQRLALGPAEPRAARERARRAFWAGHVSPRFVDVALPVPLRRTFTYRMPDGLSLEPGVRVAVPFSGQKLAGFVLRTHDEEPDGRQARAVAWPGRFEPEPVFPGGAACAFCCAPPTTTSRRSARCSRRPRRRCPRRASTTLKASGFVRPHRRAQGPAHRRQDRRSACGATADVPRAAALRARQRALLALLEARGDVLLGELRKLIPDARGTAKKLAAQGLLTHRRGQRRQRPVLRRSAAARAAVSRPTPSSSIAIDTLTQRARRARSQARFLLHGVTGSGKTEVYLQVVAQRARTRARARWCWCPRSRSRRSWWRAFGRASARASRCCTAASASASATTPGARCAAASCAWRSARARRCSRRCRRLGVIIVDEEHDSSFKQEEGFRYHARDMAMLRAHMAGALCVLGSATPSLESYFLADAEAHPQARCSRSAPKAADARGRGRRPGAQPGQRARAATRCSPRRCTARSSSCLADGEQAILFLNRRGFAPSLRCAACSDGRAAARPAA